MIPSPRIRITRRFTFEMAHALTGHDGACAQVHGHSYALEVTVIGRPNTDPASPKQGMVMDFTDLKRLVNEEVIAPLDHSLVLHASERDHFAAGSSALFERLHFVPFQPTCENLLADMVPRLRSRLPEDVALCALRLVETPCSSAEWHAHDD